MSHYEVRFHLAAGTHYKNWQIKHRVGRQHSSQYVNPADNQLILYDCELINKSRIAQRVFDRQVRDVCGWIKCQEYEICSKEIDLSQYRRLKYDPKIITNWHFADDENKNIDGKKFDELITFEKGVYFLIPTMVLS